QWCFDSCKTFLSYLLTLTKTLLQTVNLPLIIRKVRIQYLNIRIRPGFSIRAGENEVFWQRRPLGALLWRNWAFGRG
ncbi:hypothetical protein DQR00_21375, partial [Salmonella enterica subsp. salamae serovar Sofia]|nr:hypothetical protein [Salmonella enterica subsp. salamae serovar Sofia]